MFGYKIKKYFKLLLILFIGYFNCTCVMADFYSETQERWVSATILNENPNFKAGEKIIGPSGTYQAILEIIFLDRNFSLHKDCLIYKMPGGNPSSENNDGEIKVVPISFKEKCEDFLLEDSKIKMTKIYNFGYEFKNRKLSLHIDTNNYLYTFYNLKLTKQYSIHDSGASAVKEPGILISFINTLKGTKLSDGDVCFDVDDKCRTIKKNLCHLCPGKVLESIASNCRTKYKKYCQNNTCGEKGMPACIRGNVASGYTGRYCIPGSPVGFCQKPFKVFCQNEELICL